MLKVRYIFHCMCYYYMDYHNHTSILQELGIKPELLGRVVKVNYRSLDNCRYHGW